MIDRLRNAGVEVRFFHPLGWFTITRMNNRTHRKLLIVDAKIGFTGGVGISDDWEGDGKTPGRWRDSHFKVVGPVVGQLQSTFTDDWVATSPNVLYGKEYFPPIEPVGSVRAQMFKSAPREGAASAELMYLLAIRAAKREILLQYAYFVPGELALKSLHDARARGVRIRLIVPGAQVDSEWTRLASRQNYGELLEDGVEIYEYQPALYHVKAMVIDDAFASVGSTNFDDRSFRLNSEANLNVFDEGFARTLKTAFEADLALSKRVTLEEWKRRSLKEKTLGALVTLIDNQL
jgi:cardiolipin synthase